MEEKKENWSVTAEIRAEQKAALKEMKAKAKLAYFWEYYKIHAIVTVVAIVVAASFLYNIITNRDYSFYALFINAHYFSGDTMAEDFSRFSGIDNDNLRCFIETDMAFNREEFTSYEAAAVQRITATVMTGDLDVITADAYTFIYFADSEFFADLRDVFSEAELKPYQDNLFYIDQAVIDKRNATVGFDESQLLIEKTFDQMIAEAEARRQPENMADPVPVGIFLADTVIDDAYFETAFPVFGIIASSGRFDIAAMYLDFLCISHDISATSSISRTRWR